MSDKLDITRRGSATPTQEELASVTIYMQRMRPGRPASVSDIAHAVGIGGRTVRAAVSRLDGVAFLVDVTADGYVVPEDLDSETFTANLEAQARHLLDRVTRRKAFKLARTARQMSLPALG